METGVGTPTGNDADVNPKVSIECSKDNGRTWLAPRIIALGALGNYIQRVVARRFGMARVFHLQDPDDRQRQVRDHRWGNAQQDHGQCRSERLMSTLKSPTAQYGHESEGREDDRPVAGVVSITPSI